jgi:predicted ATP-grasp superfamily ATP-dependent carboligase
LADYQQAIAGGDLMRILVLDGNQNQTVACVRSLAKQGHTVLVGDTSSWSKAGWSRWCSRTFQYPAPSESNGMISRLSDLVRCEPGTLILPMSDETNLMVSLHREALEREGARLVLPAHDDVLRGADKEYTTRLAESMGIDVPETHLVTNSARARDLAGYLIYPVVLKPRTSEEQSAGGTTRTTGRPVYAQNALEFESSYNELTQRCSEVLVQEFIEGVGIGYFALMYRGELRAEFAHRRIRDVHPTGSGGAVRVSVAPDPNIRDAALAILKKLNWHGVAMVEFRQQADGRTLFLEVNGRFWNSLSLACYSGVDFPAMVAQIAEYGDVALETDYRTGLRCRWLVGDFRHLVEVMKGVPRGYPGKFPGRIETLVAVLTPVAGTFHDNFMWSDPMPELGDWLNLAKRAFATRSKKSFHAQGRYSHS